MNSKFSVLTFACLKLFSVPWRYLVGNQLKLLKYIDLHCHRKFHFYKLPTSQVYIYIYILRERERERDEKIIIMLKD